MDMAFNGMIATSENTFAGKQDNFETQKLAKVLKFVIECFFVIIKMDVYQLGECRKSDLYCTAAYPQCNGQSCLNATPILTINGIRILLNWTNLIWVILTLVLQTKEINIFSYYKYVFIKIHNVFLSDL